MQRLSYLHRKTKDLNPADIVSIKCQVTMVTEDATHLVMETEDYPTRASSLNLSQSEMRWLKTWEKAPTNRMFIFYVVHHKHGQSSSYYYRPRWTFFILCNCVQLPHIWRNHNSHTSGVQSTQMLFNFLTHTLFLRLTSLQPRALVFKVA